jgi:formamidopyrimidine-DNA glycosylase
VPELPEVEVVRRGLALHLPGRTFTAFKSSGKPLRTPLPETLMQIHLPGRRVTGVTRRAKYLLIGLDSGAMLILHLGMTGKLGLFKQGSAPHKHDHLCWQLDNGFELRFNDVRRFGSIRLAAPEEVDTLENGVFKTAGPEPFSDDFNGAYLKDRAGSRIQPVKNFIMDSRVVVGIGNIYANESLFAAGIRPTRRAGSISLLRWNRLVEEIRAVLSHAIECGGSTISDFLGASGDRGYFQIHFKVYDRSGLPCPQCETIIRQVRLGGRSSFYCHTCQH